MYGRFSCVILNHRIDRRWMVSCADAVDSARMRHGRDLFSLVPLILVVAFGVLPGERLGASEAPMAAVAAVYLPGAATALVSIGAVMAMATSLNASMLVPSRLALFLARDGMLPGWLGHVDPRTGTPLIGLFLTLVCSAALLATGQLALALNLAVFALVLLYLVHSVALLLLGRLNPELNASVTLKLPRGVRTGSGLLSVAVMGVLVAVQVRADLITLTRTSFHERLTGGTLTALELMLFWGLIGFALCTSARRGRTTDGA